MSKMDDEGKGQQGVVAVDRALAILDAFTDGSPALSLTELSKRTGFYMSTLLRLAASLERFGYLHRDEQNLFRLGPSLLRLGVLYQNTFDLADYVRPALQKLVERTGESAAFYIRAGDSRICLYRHQSSHFVRYHVEEGAQLPLDRGASGRILVANTDGEGPFFEKVRNEAHYVSMGERDPDLCAVSVPVFGIHGNFLGALALAGMRSRFSADVIDQTVKILKETSSSLTRALGGRGNC